MTVSCSHKPFSDTLITAVVDQPRLVEVTIFVLLTQMRREMKQSPSPTRKAGSEGAGIWGSSSSRSPFGFSVDKTSATSAGTILLTFAITRAGRLPDREYIRHRGMGYLQNYVGFGSRKLGVVSRDRR
jgi:hypothetical protein